jgi:hypothetical protein
MHSTRHETRPAHAGEPAGPDRTLHEEMEASARALLAADGAHLQEAMDSVRWERHGLLQTLGRRAA